LASKILLDQKSLGLATCQKAGITVRMVTGDNKVTAVAIAQECNILDKNFDYEKDSVLEGPRFYNRLGGLWCKNCKGTVPCNCDPKKLMKESRISSHIKAIAQKFESIG